MNGKTSRKGTTTRTRGSKATIKSRVVDQWIAKRLLAIVGEWGDAMEVELPKGKLGRSHADLVYSHPPSYSVVFSLISGPSSLV